MLGAVSLLFHKFSSSGTKFIKHSNDGTFTFIFPFQFYISARNFQFNFFITFSGVRLSPLGTSDVNWSILPIPDDR
jgi:hypothetical protein